MDSLPIEIWVLIIDSGLGSLSVPNFAQTCSKGRRAVNIFTASYAAFAKKALNHRLKYAPESVSDLVLLLGKRVNQMHRQRFINSAAAGGNLHWLIWTLDGYRDVLFKNYSHQAPDDAFINLGTFLGTIKYNHWEIFEYMYSRSWSVSNSKLLKLISKYGRNDFARKIYKIGVDGLSESAIKTAIKYNNIGFIKLTASLAELVRDINGIKYPTGFAQICVDKAVRLGRAEIVGILVGRQSPFNIDHYLKVAASYGYTNVIEVLIRKNGWTVKGTLLALRIAAKRGFVDCVRFILPYVDSHDIYTAVLACIKIGRVREAEVIIRYGYKIGSEEISASMSLAILLNIIPRSQPRRLSRKMTQMLIRVGTEYEPLRVEDTLGLCKKPVLVKEYVQREILRAFEESDDKVLKVLFDYIDDPTRKRMAAKLRHSAAKGEIVSKKLMIMLLE